MEPLAVKFYVSGQSLFRNLHLPYVEFRKRRAVKAG